MVCLTVACAFLTLAVQGSAVDLAVSLKGKQMTLPAFAGFFQKHLSEHSHKSSAWQKQASVYLGLLESLGAAVPNGATATKTREYVDKILELLSEPRDTIRETANMTKNNTQADLKRDFQALKTAEQKAEEILDSITSANNGLTTCYSELHDIEDEHAVDCGEKDRPLPCVRMENTMMHTVEVSSKFDWTCNFNAGKNPDKCTDDASALAQDLDHQRLVLELAKQTWDEEKEQCESTLQAHRDACHQTNTSLSTKRQECFFEKFINASDYMCDWREWIQKRVNAKHDLDHGQEMAPGLLPPMKKEWEDLNLIICMLKSFRDREKMTFNESDYEDCQLKTAELIWVGTIDTLESQEADLLTSSRFNDATINLSFQGGLAEFYLAEYWFGDKYTTHVPAAERVDYSSQSISFFTTPAANGNESVYAKIPDKVLQASCSGYASIAGEAACDAAGTKCKFFDTDSTGVHHSVSGTWQCALGAGATGSMVAKKVCDAGMRTSSLDRMQQKL